MSSNVQVSLFTVLQSFKKLLDTIERVNVTDEWVLHRMVDLHQKIGYVLSKDLERPGTCELYTSTTSVQPEHPSEPNTVTTTLYVQSDRPMTAAQVQAEVWRGLCEAIQRPKIKVATRRLTDMDPWRTSKLITVQSDDKVIEDFKNKLQACIKSKWPLYVDIQYTSYDNGVVLKEFAMKAMGTATAHISVRPAWDAISVDNKNELHRTGDISQSHLKVVLARLFQSQRTIHVKDWWKKDLLVELLGARCKNVVSLDHLPKLGDLQLKYPTQCKYDDPQNVLCAAKNVHALMWHHSVMNSL